MQRVTVPSEAGPRPASAPSGRRPTRRRHRIRHPQRIEAEIRRLERREALKSWGPRLGILAAAIGLGVAEFTDSGRDWFSRLLLFGLPILALVVGSRKLREAEPRLRTAGFALAAAMIAVSELVLLPVALNRPAAGSSSAGAWVFLIALSLGAAAVEGLAAKRGIETRLGGFAGVVAAFALYLGTYGARGGLFDASLAALIVALPIGGGFGITFGLIARSLVGARL